MVHQHHICWFKITPSLSDVASFDTGLYYGGPVVCIWSFIIVSLFVLCVALNMAELASSMPQVWKGVGPTQVLWQPNAHPAICPEDTWHCNL